MRLLSYLLVAAFGACIGFLVAAWLAAVGEGGWRR